VTLVQLSDLHGNTSFIDAVGYELEEADWVILSGDLTNFEGRHKATEIITALQRYNQNILAVPGNCDHRGVGDYLDEMNMSVDRTSRRADDYAFCGVGGSIPCPGHTPSEYTEEEFKEALSGMAVGSEVNTIYIIHQPPARTMVDRVSSGAHVGSNSVREFLERSSGVLCLTGHIHESAGVDRIGNVTVVNPGPARHGRYAVITVDDARVEPVLKTIHGH
jgi:uncharacterized protein